MTELIDYYIHQRKQSEKICEPLLIEDYNLQAAYFVSPPKWHLGHTTWFFEQFILKEYCKNYLEFNPDFHFIFNSYYETLGKRIARDRRGLLSRPILEGVYEYRKLVDDQIISLLEGNQSETIKELIYLGIQHEQQHQELLYTDIKYNLFQNPLRPVFDDKLNKIQDQNKTKEKWIVISEGLYQVGHDKDEEFCYDNELGSHKVYLNTFSISSNYVTNREYLEFIEAGGYQNFRFWLDEGWAWVKENNIQAPLYWEQNDKEWKIFTFSGMQNLPLDSVLSHISYYEAQAFASWKKMRLPTEFEWEIASGQFDWGVRWEWTNSAYLPYPNFEISEDAKGEYNGKFMNNQMVLRGSSVVTSLGHSRKTYRNFFHPQERWQFSGIRLVKN
ncbi:ergothioneine biosynthesis protein EgtB [Aureivirga sp. CE67]|uniref:ergothioneine biosynthesis protein EgtB n=1 Tax=Aureivirga sp. CE67 TaxID=1788983 RepID=UPI0018CB3C14|nr:ergothioneine biosynthesis protein EgtB [Aureivirga sp. CE67]